MGAGLITYDGRILKAELFSLADGPSSGASARGIFWAAAGSGDSTFTNSMDPPAECATQTVLTNEKIRKKYTSKQFLTEDATGLISMGGRKFNVSTTPTGIALVSWLFDFVEANFTWKEIGFFGGDVILGGYYNAAAPPVASGIAGVTVNFVYPENTVGTGTLSFTAVGTALTWTAPGSTTAGPAVNVGTGGDFVLQDGGDSAKKIRVSVDATAIPSSDSTTSPTIGDPGNVALNGVNGDANPTGQVAQSGRLFVVRNINDQVKTSASQRPVRLLVEP